ncbi:hypothetical protein V2G26_005302 [Clonostachys chloroleuca]
MVRVPTSKACNTCRERKKGCDRRTPACGQCILAGFECGGYTRDHLFVHAKVTNGRNKAIYTKKAPQSDITLHPSLESKARDEKYLGLYWSALLPGSRTLSPDALEFSTGGWTTVAGQLCESENTLRQAILATSLSMLGDRDNNATLKLNGLQTYTRAVQSMVTAIRSSRQGNTDGLLAAVRFMIYFEIFFSSEGSKYRQMGSLGKVKGWEGHKNGEIALYTSRGADSLRTGFGHQLFVDGRLHTLYESITQRKASPFSTFEWKTVPWEVEPKTVKDLMVDFMTDIPGLLEDLDYLRSNYSEALRQELLDKCTRIEAEIAEWEDIIGPPLQMYDYDFADGAVSLPTTDKGFAILHLSQFYWSACLLLYSTIWFSQTILPLSQSQRSEYDAQSHPAITSSCANGTPLVGAQSLRIRQSRQTAPTAYAFKLAHSFYLAYLPGAGALGSHCSTFPLMLTLSYLTMAEGLGLQCSEKQMIESIFDIPFLGSHVGQFSRKMWNAMPRDDGGLYDSHSYWWRHGFQVTKE